MTRIFLAVSVALAVASPARAQFFPPLERGSQHDFYYPLRQFNSGPTSTGAYGSYTDNYNSPQRSGEMYRQEQLRREYRDQDDY